MINEKTRQISLRTLRGLNWENKTYKLKGLLCFSYLRVLLMLSRYSFSHAFVLMARIPETTWFIHESRWSETPAVRRRNLEPAADSRA